MIRFFPERANIGVAQVIGRQDEGCASGSAAPA